MTLLTLETTCDETAAAVIAPDLRVLSSVVASQDDLHRAFGGVVPEIASRAHVERVLPVVDEALTRAGVTLADLTAIGVATAPGLAGSLLVGLVAAKTLCVATGAPLVAVNHLQAHVYACRLSAGRDIFPCVGLVVSGGHSHLYRCASPIDFEPLGGTIDDAAGEAFDKVASMLGLPFPGGPNLSRLAEAGDPTRFRFPRPLLDDPARIAFSFSGLKTAVRREVLGPGSPAVVPTHSEQDVADIAAGFQAAVVDCVVGKADAAMCLTGFRTLAVGGGVAANKVLRARLESLSVERGYELHIPPMALCTDNAVMGAIAYERLRAGLTEPLELDATPGLVR